MTEAKNPYNNPLTKFQSGLGLGLVFLAIFLFPNEEATMFNGNIKGLTLSLVALLFFLSELIKKESKVTIQFIDICWIALIGFTGASIYWATNENYALFGFFSTTLLYLCFKIFQTIEWNNNTAKWFTGIAFCLIILNLGYQYYNLQHNFFSDSPTIGNAGFLSKLGAVNHHWFGGCILVLLPFLLFQKKKALFIVGIILLVANISLSIVAGSAFVFLLGILLGFITIVIKSKIALKPIVYTFGAAAILLAGSLSIIYLSKGSLQGVSFFLDEFYEQSDRFWMWKNSLYLFSESPFVGIGKNNWEILSGKWGYEGCEYCTNDPLIANRYVHTHNAIFQIISELGIVGLLLYGSIGIIPIYNLIKNWAQKSTLQMAAFVSLLLFLLLCMMYGIVYNYYNHFQGLPVIGVFSLAIISKGRNAKLSFAISKYVYGIVFALLTVGTGLYFYKFNEAENKFKKGNSLQLAHYNLGQTELIYQSTLPYLDQSKVYGKLGELYTLLGYPENSLAAYQKAIVQDPNNLILLYDYINQLYQEKRYQAAAQISESAYRSFPQYLPIKVLYIQSSFQIGKVKLAKQLAIALKTDLEKQISWMKHQEGQGRLNDILRKKSYYIQQLAQVISWNTPSLVNSEQKKPRFITLDQYKNFPVLPQSAMYTIDEISGTLITDPNKKVTISQKDDLVIRGWAIDNFAMDKANGVLIKVGNTLYRAMYQKKRADVAKAFKNPIYKNSGFLGVIPSGTLPIGEHKIAILVLKKDGTAIFEPSSKNTMVVNIE